ncbi:DUF3857 domain-containing protein [Halobacteriovorax sp. DPLXC-1]|uniref:DUF3857 domain-containing protein n=1 Tax=Halobacteriovorax sp. DPLXC-1 TaxID=3110771 RepID=UPI002FF23315
MINKIYFFVLVVLSLLQLNSNARYATKKDLSFQILDSHSTYFFKSSGHLKEEQKQTYEVLNSHGVEKYKIFKIPYNYVRDNLIVHSIKVSNGDKTIVVDLSKSQRIPASASNDGLTSTYFYAVPIPSLAVNSTFTVKYTKQSKIPRMNFDSVFTYGYNVLEQNSTVEIYSEKPIFYKENDPTNSVLVESSKNDNGHKITIKQIRPVLSMPYSEQGAIVESKDVHWVTLSSVKNWDEYADLFRLKYESRLSDKLPKSLLKIKEKAKELKGIDKIVDFILASVAKKYNYIGDWRTAQSGYIPRLLKDIESTGYGDCKDFSITVIKILRELGLKAYPAFIKRGVSGYTQYFDMSIPRSSAFNHAIVYLEYEGKSYWIDPTNESSYGLKLRDDIANREALILWDKKEKLKRTSNVSYDDNLIKITKKYNVSNNLNFRVSGNLTLTGSNILLLSELQKRGGSEVVNKFLVNLTKGIDPVDNITFNNINVDRYSYNDLKSSFEYKGVFTDRDKDGVEIGSRGLATLNTITSAFQSNNKFARYLGPIMKYEKNLYFQNVKLGEYHNSICDIKSEWIDYRSGVEFKDKTLHFFENYTLKKNIISRSEIKKSGHSKVNTEIDRCRIGMLAKFTSLDKEIKKNDSVKIAKMSVAERLAYAKNQIRKGRGGDKVVDILMGVIADDPSQIEALYLASKIIEGFAKHRGYIDKGKLKYAQLLVNKALEKNSEYVDALVQKIWLDYRINGLGIIFKIIEEKISEFPTQKKSFYRLLGKIFYNEKKYEKAIELYTKGSEGVLNPDILYDVYLNVGRSYTFLKKFNEARESLNMCLSIKPNNQMCTMRMRDSYIQEKDYANAIKWGKKTYEISQNGYGVDTYAFSYIYYGNNLFQEKKYEEAIKQYSESFKIRTTGVALLNTARSYNKLKKHEKAYEYLSRLLKIEEYEYYIDETNKEIVETLIALKKNKELLEFSQSITPNNKNSKSQVHLMALASYYFVKNNHIDELEIIYDRMKELYKLESVREDFYLVSQIVNTVYNYAFLKFDEDAVRYGKQLTKKLETLVKSKKDRSTARRFKKNFAKFTPENIAQVKQRRKIASVTGSEEPGFIDYIFIFITYYKKESMAIGALLFLLFINRRHKKIKAEEKRRRRRRKKKRKMKNNRKNAA